MTFYTLNFHYLSFQSLRNLRHKTNPHKAPPRVSLPLVTVQLPIFNEKYVAARLLDAICKLDYPIQKLQIQILDDSDDETSAIIRAIANHYKLKGFDITHIQREDRSGYKAGALKIGTQCAKGEFIAIFDADFIPESDFLKNVVMNFTDPKLGFVQCRWGHVNETYSTLTEAEAISLDLHFLIEQKAKSLSHLFMTFNGAAGVWRRSCIKDAGGWHTNTLVEDLDLSYRAQLKGWKCLFLEDIVVSAELPVQMNAAKRQQFRWAKGSIQVAMKLLPNVILQKRIPIDTKIQAFIQLTRHSVHPLFLVQFMILPILLGLGYELYEVGWAPLIGILIYIFTGPLSYLYVIRKIWKDKWKAKARQYLFLILFSTGISVNNTIAIFDALLHNKSEFLRTPKFGILRKKQGWKDNTYVLPFTKTSLLELFFSVYGCLALVVSIFSHNLIFLPLIAIQTIGFIYVTYLGIVHSKRSFPMRQRSGSTPIFVNRSINKCVNNMRVVNRRNDTINSATIDNIMTRKTRSSSRNDMSNKSTMYRKLALVGILLFIGLGAAIAYYGYQQTIYPVDKATGYLSRAETSQTAEMLVSDIQQVQQLLPKHGNPVWSFSTPRTDLALIQNDLGAMISRANSVSSQGPTSSAYNAALQDIHASIKILQTNLEETLPYLYVSFSNVILGIIWMAIILSIFTIMARHRRRMTEYEQ
ncbi:MAG TPA: cellulose synthase family protein [Nitrososphaeraceae archaeon]|nr:cellulose synthase family protein [Nitrososphaeraceae archaeon]